MLPRGNNTLPGICPPDRLPLEGETIFQRVTKRSRADYVIDADGCWVWQKFTLRGYPVSGTHKMHRVYWERANGPIPAGWHVHHVCRNPSCVNPAHLEAIDPHEHHSFHRRGDSKLTEADVAEIRASPLTAKEAAKKWGVSQSLIAHIQTGQTWIGVGPARPEVYCGHCGELITSGNRGKLYCSKAHQRAFNQRKYRERLKASASVNE